MNAKESFRRTWILAEELTAQVFLDNPFVTDEKMYFTGDIASWTVDGEIVLAGRVDDQVKLRGLRVELQEVVSCIESYPGVSAAAARICALGGQDVLGVTIKGAVYPLRNHTLTPHDSLCVSNEFEEDEVVIDFISGTVILMETRDK